MYKILKFGRTIYVSSSWSKASDKLAQIERNWTGSTPLDLQFILVAE